MTYRDDRDGLHARIDRLEDDLRDARGRTPRRAKVALAALCALLCVVPGYLYASTVLTGAAQNAIVGTYTAPAPGDLVTGNSIQVPVQGLANDIATLSNRMTNTQSWIVTPAACPTGGWKKPANTTANAVVEVILIGGGGGGGGGAKRAGNAQSSGGAGGAGGAITRRRMGASLLASCVDITIGTGGAGGPAQTTDDSNGNLGVTGNNTLFAVGGLAGATSLIAGGGLGGTGGALVGSVGGAQNTLGDFWSGPGANGAINSAGAAAANSAGAPGGGSGGGCDGVAGNNCFAGGLGGVNGGDFFNAAAGGIAIPSNGAAGTTSLLVGPGGGGGGGSGGCSNGTCAGGTGGAGGSAGGGGGGGGSGKNTGAATNGGGAGGAGVPGFAIVITTNF